MHIDVEEFRIHRDEAVDLNARPTIVAPIYESKKHYRKLLKEQVKQLGKLQHRLYASNTYSLLVISKAWIPPAKTAPSATSCLASTHRAVRSTAYSTPAPRS